MSTQYPRAAIHGHAWSCEGSPPTIRSSWWTELNPHSLRSGRDILVLESILWNLFSLIANNFSGFFAVKLCHFIANYFSICNVHSSLTAKIRKQRKIKFNGIGFWSQSFQTCFSSFPIFDVKLECFWHT